MSDSERETEWSASAWSRDWRVREEKGVYWPGDLSVQLYKSRRAEYEEKGCEAGSNIPIDVRRHVYSSW